MEEPHQFTELGGNIPPKPTPPIYDLPIADKELADANPYSNSTSISLDKLTPEDRSSFYFLTLLYFVQGVPVGLAFGSIPYLLKERLSYSQVGLFTFASYPYSLKLLWSPIVDGIYSRKFGRRRSWIIPIQMLSSVLLIVLSRNVTALMDNAELKLPTLTFMFGLLIFACATQDIAVDGWALTLLSKPALPYASTAQTIGMNAGYFTSFTVFLALSSPEFANKYLRTVPNYYYGVITLSGYLFWCAMVYILATIMVIFRRKQDPRTSTSEENNIIGIYKNMIKVLKLSNMQSLIIIHLVAKIAFQAAETVTNLKLLERGLSKEDLALVVLIDFPFEVFFGYYAAKWSSGKQPLNPWIWAYVLRLIFACISMSQVYYFPQDGISTVYLLYVILVHVLGSFLSTVQFVSITAFHTQIADPEIGGTYMTVLNTLCNLGGQWPRALVLAGVDMFTEAYCTNGNFSCVHQDKKFDCSTLGGTCVTKHDGYYFMNILCVVVGVTLFTTYIRKTMRRLQSLPPQAWRHQH